MKNIVLVSVVAANILFLTSACVSVTEVEIEPEVGGIISESPARSPEARKKTIALMNMNCGSKKAKIVKEGNVKVGQTESSDLNTKPQQTTSTNVFTGKKTTSQGVNTSGKTTISDINEWRVQYKCL